MPTSAEETSLVRWSGMLSPATRRRSWLMALVERYQGTVYRFGRRMCPSEPDAEDVLQETLMALVQKIGELRGDASLSSWLLPSCAAAAACGAAVGSTRHIGTCTRFRSQAPTQAPPGM